MPTHRDPTPESSRSSEPSVASPTARRVAILAFVLSAFAYPVDRWLQVVDHAAETYTKLKASGLLDLILGG